MKTVSLTEEACARLEETKRNTAESISEVVLRAVAPRAAGPAGVERPWMQLFGCLRDDADELRRIDRVIDVEFEQINPEDWR